MGIIVIGTEVAFSHRGIPAFVTVFPIKFTSFHARKTKMEIEERFEYKFPLAIVIYCLKI